MPLGPNEFSFVCSRHRIGIRRARSESPPYLSLLPLSLSLRHRHPTGTSLPVSLSSYTQLAYVSPLLSYPPSFLPFLVAFNVRVFRQLTHALPHSSRFPISYIMSAPETTAVAPVEDVKPIETTPAPVEAAPAVEEPKVEAAPVPAVSRTESLA